MSEKSQWQLDVAYTIENLFKKPKIQNYFKTKENVAKRLKYMVTFKNSWSTYLLGSTWPGKDLIVW